MIILVTGSRHADFRLHGDEISLVLRWIGAERRGPHTLIEGGAAGADRIARACAEGLGWTVETMPANWAKEGRPAAGPLRNQRMVDKGPDVCLAFPLLPVAWERSGTMDCAKRAINAGIRTLIFPLAV